MTSEVERGDAGTPRIAVEATSRPLRIAHLTHHARGGAGRAAQRARDACRAAGMVSEAFCLDGAVLGQDVIQPRWQRNAPDPASKFQDFMFKNLQWSEIRDKRRGTSNTLLSIPYPGMDVMKLSALNAFDVLHIHWSTWTMTPPDMRRWLDAGRALVWTLHDAWAMTGGCHYPSGCEQYLSECIVCPQLNDGYGVVPNAFSDKLRHYGNDARLQVIAPSVWLAHEARRSRIFGGTPVHQIENPIELDIFEPRAHRRQLRRDLGFDDRDLVLLFGNQINDEIRKGGAVLREAIAKLLEPESLAGLQTLGIHLAFLTFGTPIDLGIATESVKTLAVDSVDKDSILVDLFNVADVLCFPSLEDNYPNTIVEAAACGTPAIVFRTGGMATMVQHGETGLIVDEVGSAADFAQAIRDFASKGFQSQGMRAACRAQTEATNDPAKIGSRLAQVYRQSMPRAPEVRPEEQREAQPEERDDAALSGDAAHTPPGLSETAKEVHRLSTIRVSPRMGSDFLRHPLNRRLAQLAETRGMVKEAWRRVDATTLQSPTPQAAGKHSVALASTLHAHHAAYAGPYQFARHLDRDRFELRHYRTPLGSDLIQHPAAIQRASKIGRALGLEGFAAQPNGMLTEFDLLADMRHTRYDVVHFLDGELCGWLAPRAARRLYGNRAPAMVMSLHQPPAVLERMISLERLADIDLVLAMCESQAQFLRDYAPQVQVRVIPHGIATDFFKPPVTPRDFATPDERPFKLLGVGHWLRDYAMALDAIAQLNAIGMACEYTIICHNFPSDLKLPPNAKVVSGLSDAELLQSYHEADALLLPMEDATANNAILEAMACGLPVFSNDVGGIREMTGSAAFTARPGDAQALALALRRAACQPEIRQQMIELGFARAQALSWAAVTPQFERAYEEAIAWKEQRHVRRTA